MRIYCYKCHSILQYCREMANPSNPNNEGIKENVYECPRCKYEIVIQTLEEK